MRASTVPTTPRQAPAASATPTMRSIVRATWYAVCHRSITGCATVRTGPARRIHRANKGSTASTENKDSKTGSHHRDTVSSGSDRSSTASESAKTYKISDNAIRDDRGKKDDWRRSDMK